MAVAQIIIVLAALAIQEMMLLAAYDIGKCDGKLEALEETEEDLQRLMRRQDAQLLSNDDRRHNYCRAGKAYKSA